MARYERTYAGELRTQSIGIKLTPTERAKLEAAATARGVRLSDHVREVCLRRSSAAAVGSVTRNSDARALARELTRIGNNLNQLTKIANTKGNSPHLFELRSVTGLIKSVLARALDL